MDQINSAFLSILRDQLLPTPN